MRKKLLLLIFLLASSLYPLQNFAGSANLLKGTFPSENGTGTFQTNKEFLLTPNPASSTINVYLPRGFEKARLTVFDVLGKEIYNAEVNSLHSTINISKWNSGVYLVRVATDTESQTKRFVKQ